MTSIDPHARIQMAGIAPKKIDYYGHILTLEVTKTQMPDKPYRAVYWYGAEDYFNWYAQTPEDAALTLWINVRRMNKSIKPVPEPHEVTMNGRSYIWNSIVDAVKFCEMWNGVLITPINNI